MIDLDTVAIGLIDLYEYNWQKQNAGIGIVILKKYRRKGFAKQALKALIKHGWKELRLKQLHTGIFSDNKASLALFKAVGFMKVKQNDYVLNR